MTGRWDSAYPIAARMAGRTNTSNDTIELTGLPGSVTTGTPSNRPAPCGIPGCIATLANSTPWPVRASFTTSYAPADTPPEVRSRSASARCGARVA